MSKRIIICCDGTWNTADQKQKGQYNPTNVTKIARAIKPGGKKKAQLVFYDQGVGTGNIVDRLLGGAFGIGLSKNIIDGYRFIIHNFEPGDDIFLFGFSRGAYTVRSLGGLIRNCGILKKEHSDQIEAAFKLYRRDDAKPDSDIAKEFIRIYAIETRIKFIGVWDTVGSLGIPIGWLRWLTKRKHQFHDVQLSSKIDNAYHALAIDERRAPFKPTFWETKADAKQQVEQKWFPGVHSNVGGGYVNAGLSDEAFVWILGKAILCGLKINQSYIDSAIFPNYAGTLYNSKTGLFKLTKSYTRPMGLNANSGEDVHQSAYNRLADVPNYTPKNFLSYIDKSQKRAIYQSINVKASLQKVWTTWTTEEGCKTFFAPDCKIDFHIGGAYEIYFDNHKNPGSRGSEGCTICAIQRLHFFSFTWNAPTDMPDIRSQRTLVTIHFNKVKNEETAVVLIHTGWGTDDKWDAAFDYFNNAWQNIVLPRLQQSFLTGPVNWESD